MPVANWHSVTPGRKAISAGYQNWQEVVRVSLPSQHTYVAMCMGTLGGFSAPVAGGRSAQVKFVVTDSAGVITQESFSPIHELYQAATLLGADRGSPFFAVVQFTAGVGDAHLRILAHAGDAGSAVVSDAGIWLWDQDALLTHTTFATATWSGATAAYPSFTQLVGVSTPTYATSTDTYLVAWSVETLWPDPSFGYHTRCRRLSDGAVLMGGAYNHGGSAEHAGIGQVGFRSGFDRFVMGGFRAFQVGVGLGTHDDIVVEFARPKFTASSGPPPAQPSKASVFVARIQALDDRSALYTTDLVDFTGANGPGTAATMAFVPATPQGPSTFLLAGSAGLPDTLTVPFSARLQASLDGNFQRVGTNGLYVPAFPGDASFPGGGYVSPYPQQSILLVPPNPSLGNTTHTLALAGAGYPPELAAARRGYDVSHVVVSSGTQVILAAPVEDSPGPDVYLRFGNEAPRLSAIDEVPIAASYVEDLDLEYSPVSVRFDDGHVGGWAQQMVALHHRRIHWDALRWDVWDTQVRPVIQTAEGKAWQLRVDGEAVARVFRTRGALTNRAIVAPTSVVGVWSVTVDALEIELVGP